MSLAVGALSFACGAAGAEAEAVTPVEGNWSAITSAGLPVSFEVRAGQVMNARFKFRWGNCGTFESAVGNSVGIDPSGHWKYLDSRGPWIEGDFVAPDRVEGKVFAPSRSLPFCPQTEATFVASQGEAILPEEPEVLVMDNVFNGHLAKRPHKIFFEYPYGIPAPFYLYGIKWQSYGGPVARAAATAYFPRTRVGCCAWKEVKRLRVTLRLTHLIPRGRYRIYGRLDFVLHGPIPHGVPHHGFQNMPV